MVRCLRLVVLAFLTAACASALAVGGTAARSSTARCPTTSKWLASWRTTFAARVLRPTSVYRRPWRSPFTSLPTADRYGFPTTVSVLERVQNCQGRWYRVRLAKWPNGTTGWIRSKDVKTTRLHARILIDVSQHRLYFYKAGRLVLKSAAAIGKPSTPTPLGAFFVTQRFVVSPTTGPFGPRAIGISAFSNVLRTWTDGGPIGIHGTNEPFSIGNPVSHGCVRLPNNRILRLFARTPLGTPVLIRR
jgi:lipoprotein-anchoring transpeptidase ErfK/SrfK